MQFDLNLGFIATRPTDSIINLLNYSDNQDLNLQELVSRNILTDAELIHMKPSIMNEYIQAKLVYEQQQLDIDYEHSNSGNYEEFLINNTYVTTAYVLPVYTNDYIKVLVLLYYWKYLALTCVVHGLDPSPYTTEYNASSVILLAAHIGYEQLARKLIVEYQVCPANITQYLDDPIEFIESIIYYFDDESIAELVSASPLDISIFKTNEERRPPLASGNSMHITYVTEIHGIEDKVQEYGYNTSEDGVPLWALLNDDGQFVDMGALDHTLSTLGAHLYLID